MRTVQIDPWLPLVEKPSRYIDHEINSIRKPWQEVNFCFIYPDVYEVGISHLGLKILYSIVNKLDNIMADRCYLPWLDMIEIMRREELPLFGIESRRELRHFDLLGITLQSELTYSNILEVLDLAGMALLAKDRDDTEPIVLAGGPCATNPLPLAPYIDAFFIGEAEDAIKEIASIFQNFPGKTDRLQKLAELESCFVPSIHLEQVAQGWTLRSRKFKGFSDYTDTHTPQLLSWQLATHNRCVAEIMRGCSRGCRFCHAGYFYRPVRERSARDIQNDLQAEIHSSGWDEAGLLSLSSNDYSRIKDLLSDLLASVDTNKTHISLPSLRVDSLDDETVELMRKLGREGLTIAPEAGTERLRNIINKNLTQEQILTGVRTALALGWQKIKLYFMIGLPFETEEDIEGIIDLIGLIASTGRKRLQINVTLSPFVPKPFTPFQWAAMLPPEELLKRCLHIKQAFSRQRYIKIKYHTIENSLLEAVFARGDLQIGKVLLQAWKLGARFDGWNECFDYSIWRRAFDDCGIDPAAYLAGKDPSQSLPWDFIDIGIQPEFLRSEWSKAEQAVPTADCREICSQCGVCTEDLQTVSAPVSEPHIATDSDITAPSPKPDRHTQSRYRVYYSKGGILRFISHLDWMRMLFRVISKSSLEVVFTEGFSPHPKVGLCPPLPLGVQGECEFFDISFYQPYLFEEVSRSLSQGMIPDFKLLRYEPLLTKALTPSGEWIQISLPEHYIEPVTRELAAFDQMSEYFYTKSTDTRSKTYNLKDIIHQTLWLEGNLLLRKSLASPALYDVLSELFKLDKASLYTFEIVRKDWVY